MRAIRLLILMIMAIAVALLRDYRRHIGTEGQADLSRVRSIATVNGVPVSQMLPNELSSAKGMFRQRLAPLSGAAPTAALLFSSPAPQPAPLQSPAAERAQVAVR
jgi:hypothetical protein